MQNKDLDLIYEELELIGLEEIEELENSDGLETYYEDYRAFEQDLTDLIKEGK